MMMIAFGSKQRSFFWASIRNLKKINERFNEKAQHHMRASPLTYTHITHYLYIKTSNLYISRFRHIGERKTNTNVLFITNTEKMDLKIFKISYGVAGMTSCLFWLNCHDFRLTFLPILCKYKWKMEWVLSLIFVLYNGKQGDVLEWNEEEWWPIWHTVCNW